MFFFLKAFELFLSYACISFTKEKERRKDRGKEGRKVAQKPCKDSAYEVAAK